MPEIISKVLIHNLLSMEIRKISLSAISVEYSGQNPWTGQYEKMYLNMKDALVNGEKFISPNNTTFIMDKKDMLPFQVHKHCRHLDIKIESDHEFTMKEMVNICPNILIDLVKNKGGLDYIARVLIGYEELYNQQKQK